LSDGAESLCASHASDKAAAWNRCQLQIPTELAAATSLDEDIKGDDLADGILGETQQEKKDTPKFTYVQTKCPADTEKDKEKWIVTYHTGDTHRRKNAEGKTHDVKIYHMRAAGAGTGVGGANTASVMKLHNKIEQEWRDGKFTHDADKSGKSKKLLFGQGSLTRDTFFQLESSTGKCWAMGAYMEVKQSSDEFHAGGGTNTYVNEMHLRAVKFSVCYLKNGGTHPTCATRKLAMDCWYQAQDNAHGKGVNPLTKARDEWHQCVNHPDKAFVAATMART
jgi:hypothetical protein